MGMVNLLKRLIFSIGGIFLFLLFLYDVVELDLSSSLMQNNNYSISETLSFEMKDCDFLMGNSFFDLFFCDSSPEYGFLFVFLFVLIYKNIFHFSNTVSLIYSRAPPLI
jgi:hypothetical protein